jgi:hypothetical protein
MIDESNVLTLQCVVYTGIVVMLLKQVLGESDT